ncbi:NUDIX hydrolase [Lapillicoccus jejuensis]|uniref:8-oxo-dGTP pyrophosphatase MutT (NUDIX family) n=1 Tax=Lapillicoccus jejuensis TaxID=402171 RepID=A0A542E5M7_9MICO|nr:NUDIX domain-containing protein [Lapillicoccus jejuensis]TQJ10645.1 8-oxo-dGTP pyrophosphatase MutT (NUDIX family) [Lapillicoccus jejuensis]
MTTAAGTPHDPPTPVVRRRAARLLLLDEDLTHVLLIRGCDPRRPEAPYWFTVGGGVDAGEGPREAAVREAREEVGLDLDTAEVDGPFLPHDVAFPFDGVVIEQHQDVWVAVVPRTTPRFLGVDDVERAATLEVRWVPLDGLAALGEPVFPAPDAVAEVVARWRAVRASATGQSRPPA